MFLAFSSFYFQVFGASLLLLFWILFQGGYSFPLCLFGLVTFYLAVSFVLYFSVFSPSFFYFLTCSTWGLLSPGFRVVLDLPFDFCPWRETLVGGLCWFLVRVDMCLCSSGRRPRRKLQKYGDIYTDFHTHGYNQSALKKRAQETDLGSEEDHRWLQPAEGRGSECRTQRSEHEQAAPWRQSVEGSAG